MFKDRVDAGRQLAQHLLPYQKENPIILALPRGGVVVGAEVAQVLRTPLEILVVRKVGAPENPEYGLGAITENNVSWMNRNTVEELGITTEELTKLMLQERREVQRRVELYRKGHPAADVSGRTVILVDDGLATGGTVLAAISWLKKQRAGKIILAIPVGVASAVEVIQSRVDGVVCVEILTHLFSISQEYEDFAQVSDEAVIQLLNVSELRQRAA